MEESIFDRHGRLCHIVIKPQIFDNLVNGSRLDVSEDSEFLQLAIIKGKAGSSFRPHRHLERQRTLSNLRAQESWVILEGIVEVQFFDDDGMQIAMTELHPGSISITYRGGHGYRIITDAKVLEYKSGPYEGQLVDKIFIDEPY